MSLHIAARRYLGVPFLHQGRSERGLDCVGLLFLSAADCGWDVAAFDTTYGRKPQDGLLDARLRAALGAPVSDIRPGDIASLRYGREPRHAAVIGDHPNGLSLIHADSRVGLVVEHLIDARWASRIVNVYRRAV